MAEIDFTKYANAIGAIYRRNKDLEHINLLEATSAKESKGMNGYLMALAGACVGTVALVGAIVIGLAAVIIGDVIFGKLFKNFALRLLAAVLGGVIYYIVIQLVLQMGLNANDLKLFSALVVALFLGVPYWKGQLSAKHVKTNKGGKDNA